MSAFLQLEPGDKLTGTVKYLDWVAAKEEKYQDRVKLKGTWQVNGKTVQEDTVYAPLYVLAALVQLGVASLPGGVDRYQCPRIQTTASDIYVTYTKNRENRNSWSVGLAVEGKWELAENVDMGVLPKRAEAARQQRERQPLRRVRARPNPPKRSTFGSAGHRCRRGETNQT